MSANYKDSMRLNGYGLKGKRMKRWYRGMWANYMPNGLMIRNCNFMIRKKRKPLNNNLHKAIRLSLQKRYETLCPIPF